MKIYTTGYHGGPGSKSDRTLQNLKALCERRELFVADIRHVRWSRNPLFTEKSLSDFLGRLYVPVSNLGNQNYRGDMGPDFVIPGLSLALPALQEWSAEIQLAPLLLCGCTDFESCHRKYVADMARLRLFEGGEEISRWGE